MNYEDMNIYEIGSFLSKASEDKLLCLRKKDGQVTPIMLESVREGEIVFETVFEE